MKSARRASGATAADASKDEAAKAVAAKAASRKSGAGDSGESAIAAKAAASALKKPSSAGLSAPGGKKAGSGEAEGPAEAIQAEDAGARGAQKGSEARVSVLDLRQKAASRAADTRGASSSAKASEAESASREEGSSPRKEIVRDMGIGQFGTGSGERTERSDRAEAPARSAAGGDFSSMLAQRLRESGNGEIVQAAHIVLKDGDAGDDSLEAQA